MTPDGRHSHQARVARVRPLEGERGREVEVRSQLGRPHDARSTSSGRRDKLDWIKLIHFHLGSQITDIRFIKNGLPGDHAVLRRAARRWASTSRTSTSAAGSAWTTTARTPTSRLERELLAAGVRQRHRLHRRRGMPRARAADAALISESGRALTAHHALLLLKVIDVESQRGPGRPDADGGRPRAAARDGRRPQGRAAQERLPAADARDLPRPHVRQGTRARAVQQRRALAARARDRRADLLRDAQRHRAARRCGTATTSRTSSRTSRRRWSTATSATSRSSSRCRTAGRSTSSSRSCRSIGSTSSRRGARRSRT